MGDYVVLHNGLILARAEASQRIVTRRGVVTLPPRMARRSRNFVRVAKEVHARMDIRILRKAISA